MASSYCSVTDVRNLFPNSVSQFNDTQITSFIEAASAWMEGYTQRIMSQSTYTEFAPIQLDRYMRLVIRCYQWPITAVSAISYRMLGAAVSDWTVLDPAQVDIYHPPDRFIYYVGSLSTPSTASPQVAFRMGSRSIPGTVTFTYTAGYVPPYPADLVLACANMTIEMAMADANPAGAQTIQAGAEGAQDTVSFGQQSRHVTRAMDILDRFYTRRI